MKIRAWTKRDGRGEVVCLALEDEADVLELKPQQALQLLNEVADALLDLGYSIEPAPEARVKFESEKRRK